MTLEDIKEYKRNALKVLRENTQYATAKATEIAFNALTAHYMLVEKYSPKKTMQSGKWETHPDEYEICATEFTCSNCKEVFCSSEMTDEQMFQMMKYCPNCGAKMRKEDEGK